MSQNQYPGIDARLVSIVNLRSRKLVGHYGIAHSDLADLHQEWIVQIIGKAEYADRDHPQFERRMAHLVNLLAIDEIRRRRAAKRNGGRLVFSLDYDASAGDAGPSLGERLTEEDYLELTGGQSRSAFERAEVRCDVEAFLRQLPEELRQLAETLQAHNVDSLAAHLGLSRATAYRRLQALRQAAQKFFSESENI